MSKCIRACIMLESDGTHVRVSTPTDYMSGGSAEECLSLINNFFERIDTILDKSKILQTSKTHQGSEELLPQQKPET